jgi:transposase-like protein
VRTFHQRRLRGEYVYIFLDGVVLKVRDAQGEVRRRWVLVAYGITAQGRPELIGYQLARGESEASRTAFSHGLFLRGLEGRRLQLVIMDGSSGLRAAWGLVWPQVPLQRCWAQKLRNIADKVPQKQGSCVRDAAAMLSCHQPREAQRSFRGWAEVAPQASSGDRLRGTGPGGVVDLLCFFSSPLAQDPHHQHHRAHLPGGAAPHRPMSSFTNPASCNRIVFGAFSHLNRSWERKPLKEFTQETRHYLFSRYLLKMDSIACRTKNPGRSCRL